MPLTPADVHNVAFSKPPIGKRGYNEDEVDAFLDLVEAELARLIEENNDLRTQIEQAEQRLAGAQVELDDARTKIHATVSMPPPMRIVDDQRPLSPVPPPSPIELTSPGGDHHVQAAKVLGLAQEMADRLTGEAKAEADGMLGEARTKSEQLLSEARMKADSMVNESRSRAESMLGDARNRAETLERQAREKAASLERDAQRKHAETIGAISAEKVSLEKKIDELRTFEREYRTRLKTYLESQLRDLEGRGSAAPADTGRNSQQFATSFGQRVEAGY
jgi:DivIVA domain-containing protein